MDTASQPQPLDIPVHIQERETLTEEDIWLCQGPTVWSSRRFVGAPSFYPVYRAGDHFSFSPVYLMALTGDVQVDRGYVACIEAREREGVPYYSGIKTIDRRISRVGGPMAHQASITRTAEYVRQMASAMVEDVRSAEAAAGDATNAVLCGGKDSLNLLLLPWKNPVVAVSAAPNFPLVREFIERNRLGIDCLELKDDDTSAVSQEVLYNACHDDLRHCRWVGELRALATAKRGNLVLWKGQLGDVFLSPFWRSYAHCTYRCQRMLQSARSLCLELGLRVGHRGLAEAQQRRLFVDMWHRGAMMQGVYMSIVRAVSGCLVLSGYHGHHVRRVVSSADLISAVEADVRPWIGRELLGRDVVYPIANPSPPPSGFRARLSDPVTWLAQAQAAGLVIAHDDSSAIR